MLICVTKANKDGDVVYVNLSNINYFYAFNVKEPENGTQIHMTTGSILNVKESPETIRKAFIRAVRDKEVTYSMAS